MKFFENNLTVFLLFSLYHLTDALLFKERNSVRKTKCTTPMFILSIYDVFYAILCVKFVREV